MACAQIGLGAAELDPAGAALVARKPFLQCPLDRPLQLRVDRGAHRIGIGGDGVDAGQRLGLARDLIDEVEADVAARPLVGHHGRQRRQASRRLIGWSARAVLPDAAQHIGEPLLRAPGMTVGIVVARPLGQAGEQGALLELERIGGFSEIASRRQLDAPGAAAEIDRVEIELEDLVLAERALEARRHDHLADLALVGEVVAHQQVLHDLLGDGRAALRTPGLRRDCR